jgi:L-ascorbate metabolism protein UlaG (beta-lactamase superfamily)
MTDPGVLTESMEEKVANIDFLLYTHEHFDHFHLDSLKKIMGNNPEIKVYANVSVGDLLEKDNIPYTLLQDGEEASFGEGLKIRAFGEKHSEIDPSIPQSDNTGYFIDDRFWYPGDAFTAPKLPVEILALPVAGPWMKLSEAIEYARKLSPKKAFPVHDGILDGSVRTGLAYDLPQRILKESGIEFISLNDGEMKEFY